MTKPIVICGEVNGAITHHPLGSNGFGYDPVFYVPSHECTAAELDRQVKNQISHRGQAMAFLLEQMRQTFA